MDGRSRRHRALRQISGEGLSDALRPHRVRPSLDRRDRRRAAFGSRDASQGAGGIRRSRPPPLPCGQLVSPQHSRSRSARQSRGNLARRCKNPRIEPGRPGVSRRAGRHDRSGARCERARTRWLDRASSRFGSPGPGSGVVRRVETGCERQRADKRCRNRSVLRYAVPPGPSRATAQERPDEAASDWPSLEPTSCRADEPSKEPLLSFPAWESSWQAPHGHRVRRRGGDRCDAVPMHANPQSTKWRGRLLAATANLTFLATRDPTPSPASVLFQFTLDESRGWG